jgi:hypothetical protein
MFVYLSGYVDIIFVTSSWQPEIDSIGHKSEQTTIWCSKYSKQILN